jgi:hypothetical protein
LKGLLTQASTIANSRLWIIVLATLVISIGLELYGRSCGFILVSDSLQFLSASKSFRLEGRFLSPDGSYYSYWPPLFPMILSLSANPLVLLIWLNIICKLVVACSLLYFANVFFKDFFWKTFFISTSLLSVYFIMISVFVRSELLFMSLIFVNAYVALNLTKPRYFYWFLLTGFLMCIQRNAGLFWISGVCIWMVFDQKNSFVKNSAKTLLFFIVSTAGLWAWNFYNTFFLPANFSFYKHSFFSDWFYNAGLVTETYVKMILPFGGGLVTWLIFVLTIGLVLLLLRKHFDRSLSFFAITLIFYTAGYASMVKLDVYEMDRYFSVVTPIVFLFFFMALEKASESTQKWVRYSVISLAVLWTGYPIARTIKNVQAWHDRSCQVDSSK